MHDVNSTGYVIKIVEHLYDGSDNYGDREEKALRILRGHHHTIKLLAFETMQYRDLDYYILRFLCILRVADFHLASERESWSYFKQVLKALSYCQKNYIIHLDITPDNIFSTTLKPGQAESCASRLWICSLWTKRFDYQLWDGPLYLKSWPKRTIVLTGLLIAGVLV